MTRAGFAELTNAQRCAAMDDISRIPCAAAGTLLVNRDGGGAICGSTCCVCDGKEVQTSAEVDVESCQTVSREAIVSTELHPRTPHLCWSNPARISAEA